MNSKTEKYFNYFNFWFITFFEDSQQKLLFSDCSKTISLNKYLTILSMVEFYKKFLWAKKMFAFLVSNRKSYKLENIFISHSVNSLLKPKLCWETDHKSLLLLNSIKADFSSNKKHKFIDKQKGCRLRRLFNSIKSKLIDR